MRQKFLLAVAILGATALMSPVVSAQTVADIDPVGLQARCIVLQSKNLRYQARDSATGGEVSSLQDFLQSKGYLNSEPTGYMGLMTVSAIKSFQRANNIEATGFAGPYTRSKIKELSCKGAVLTSGPTTGPTTPTSVSIPGCVSGAVYNYLTGKRCDSAPMPVSGCASGAVYNYLTGARCDTTSTPTPILSRITLLSPNGGETFVLGKSIPITWKTSQLGTGSVSIYLRDEDNGKEYVLEDNAPNMGSYTVNTDTVSVPGIIANRAYRISIWLDKTTNYGHNRDVNDVSDSYFKIVSNIPQPSAPSITVITLNEGGYWYTGMATEIKWITANIPASNQMIIRLRNYDTGIEYNLTTSVNDGYEKIVLPSHIPAGAYTIEIKTSVNGQSYVDASDLYFKVPSNTSRPTITVDNSTTASDSYIRFNLGMYPSSAHSWTFKAECPAGVTASMKATDCGQVVRFENPNSTTAWDALVTNNTAYKQTITATFNALDVYSGVIGTAQVSVIVAPKAINYDACRLDKLDGSNITRNAYTVQSDCLSKICDIYGPANLRSGTPSKCVFNGTEIKRYQSAPTCALTSSKSSYSFGETMTFSWTSQNATYAWWQLDTSGKDHLNLPGDKLIPNGSQSVVASVVGNPTVTIWLGGNGNISCSRTVNIAEPTPPCLSGAGPLLPGQRYCGSN